MTAFRKVIQAGISSVTILGCVGLGVAVFSDIYAGGAGVVSASQAATKKQNFSGGFGGQCIFRNSANRTIKGLAIEESGQSVCICPSQQAYAVYLRSNPDAASLRCIIENGPTVNQASIGPPGGPGPGIVDGPGPVDGPGVGPRGNNGWGQEKRGGTDGTNPGSFHGNDTQRSTKEASTER